MSHLKKALLILAILPVAGCGLGNVIAFSCAFMSEPDHCYQAAAVQDADPDECAKVKGEGFTGQNPPRDKCYLMIAENTGDYAPCKEIQGGFTSYTPEECVTEIAVKKNDPDGCDHLEGPSVEACKTDFMKQSREAILSDLDDDDVKAQAVHEFLAFRDQHPGMSLKDQVAKLQEIKDQQALSKSLDDQANTLMDGIKQSASDAAGDKLKEIATDQGKAFLEAHGGEKLKQGIAELEGLKEKYDKASEQYKAVSDQVEKLKKAYDAVNEVYGKIDEVNTLVAQGKVDQGRAGVLKGAIYLSKGLEYATGYVPVFGSTASAVTKATFDATIKFAKSRAARTTAIDKCIDDPEHCDPNGITPY